MNLDHNLIRNIIEKQLRGRVKFSYENGNRFEIKFNPTRHLTDEELFSDK